MEYAFTDAIVRADRATLESRAIQYLNSYAGNFEPLLHAKRALDEGFELGVAQLRLVLNAMRADTSIQMDYKPPFGTNVITFPKRRGLSFGDEPTPPKPEPRWRTHDNFKIKLPYCMSMQLRAEVIHLVSPDRSECHYHPIGSWHDGKKVFGEPIWDFRIRYECTGDTSKKLRLLSTEEATILVAHELMRFCRWCVKLRDARTGPQDPNR